jgi:hypothetical protein
VARFAGKDPAKSPDGAGLADDVVEVVWRLVCGWKKRTFANAPTQQEKTRMTPGVLSLELQSPSKKLPTIMIATTI